ncbi:hypothetical protein ACFOD4_12955 [Pseudoroseomonas globiformis]|uniref:Glycosyltransferase family 1 protein n=1 Tax=Teichococcus globiformis TaxID=2307229 RepID=A0ABV7G2R7_9PROT
MTDFTAATRKDLYRLKRLRGLSRVVVETRCFTYRNLLPHALKYGIWALRPGGTLLVRDASPNVFDLWPRFVSFKTVRQWSHKLLAYDAEPLRLDIKAGEIEFRRTRPVPPCGWSAGVVFSGREAELPQLRRCLDALLLQPELSPERDGEITVCGPAESASYLDSYSSIRYLPYEMPSGPRVLLCGKKNALIRALKGPRIIVMHSRIQLAPDTLRHVPDEFEITTPRVLVETRSGREDYLSLGVHDSLMPGYAPRLVPSNLRRVPAGRYLDLYEQGPPYVDGGVFMLRKDVHERCPLNEAVAWDEAEDLEWCGRALAEGLLIDLAPEAEAASAVGELGSLPVSPRIMRRLRNGKFAIQAARHRLRDRAERWMGRR